MYLHEKKLFILEMTKERFTCQDSRAFRKSVKRIIRLERRFSCHNYNGGGKKSIILKAGTIPIMISAPHSVNHLRNGKIKWADKMTGGLALFLHEATGCHVICSGRYSGSDPNYDTNDNGENDYQTMLTEYVKVNQIAVLIDLHGAAKSREYAVEMGTAPSRDMAGNIIGDEYLSLHGSHFIADLIEYSFNFALKGVTSANKDIIKNKLFDAGKQNTVTRFVSQHTGCRCIQIEINGNFRDPDLQDWMGRLAIGLTNIVRTLGVVDWTAKRITACKVRQSMTHKPQDKIELSAKSSTFKENSLLYICSHIGNTETVRLHHLDECGTGNDESTGDHVYLTNRLIGELFSREWIQGEETEPYLKDVPVILYENEKDCYGIGLPKADQIDTVSFSSALHSEKEKQAGEYDFVVFNRLTDSRFHIDFSKADYKDYGRVKDENGKAAKKVMVPRYYRRLLGYIDTPIEIIREEEFRTLRNRISENVGKFLGDVYVSRGQDGNLRLDAEKLRNHRFTGLFSNPADRFADVISPRNQQSLKNALTEDLTKAIEAVYKKIKGEAYYTLDTGNAGITEAMFRNAGKIQNYSGMLDDVEILRIPKTTCKSGNLFGRIRAMIDRITMFMLEKSIGYVEYSLKAEWTSETDDKNNVARLSTNMMSLLGVCENDKIIITFGSEKTPLRVLADSELTDYQIGIPAPARKKLKMNSINDIVIVSRDMMHAFKRHSQEQTIAILGMILAVFQVTKGWLGVICCVVLTPFILYCVLNEERIKVK